MKIKAFEMHYHIAKNPSYPATAKSFPDWYTAKLFAVLPEVTQQELAKSTAACIVEKGLVVPKPTGERTAETLVNNDGRRRSYTGRELADFLVTCKKRGHSVSIDSKVIGSPTGHALERELDRILGEDGYVIASGRVPDRNFLAGISPKRQVPMSQLHPLR